MKKEIKNLEAEKTATYPKTGMKFYAVVYLYDGTVHLWPGDDKDKCFDEIKKLQTTKWKGRIRGYNVIKRNLDNYKDGMFL
jgi:hypothetical protein